MTKRPARRSRSRGPKPDSWQVWFSRLVQVAGLGIVFYETLAEQVDRPWLLLVAVAMMVGGLGLQFIVRWLLERMP